MRTWQTIRALALGGGVGVYAFEGDSQGPDVGGILEWRIASSSAPSGARAEPQPLDWLARPLGHPADRLLDDRVAAELASVVEAVSATVAVLDTVWLHSYIPSLRALGCRVVLNAHNIEAELAERIAARHGDPVTRKLVERTPQIEQRTFEAVDQIWVCSEREARQVRERYGAALPIVVVPNTVELDAYGPPAPVRETFPVVYPGVFLYAPNVAAAMRLITDIFPLVSVARARLMLVGHAPTAEMIAAAAQPRVEVTGTVASTRPFLRRAGALAVPLDEGGGTRFKVLEAFASGLPVVSNRLGVEGLDTTPHEHYLPAESDEDFASAITLLADDRATAQRIARRALALVRERYSQEVAEKRIAASLRELVANGQFTRSHEME